MSAHDINKLTDTAPTSEEVERHPLANETYYLEEKGRPGEVMLIFADDHRHLHHELQKTCCVVEHVHKAHRDWRGLSEDRGPNQVLLLYGAHHTGLSQGH